MSWIVEDPDAPFGYLAYQSGRGILTMPPLIIASNLGRRLKGI
jgi:hypothetical protein